MTNIVELNVPFRQNSKAARQVALLEGFARQRRNGEDVFWLKENAEILNVLECTNAALPEQALVVHDGFYQEIEKRLGFFPQYYRFLLSICLDLEDLGMPGNKGEKLAQWVADEGWARAELSDLQRAEARRLCQRRGIEPVADNTGLDDRLRRFAGRSETFMLPNKKAAYELTHIVFYLSHYGRVDPQLDAAFIDSLTFAGTLAFLDFNVDLLSEICIALRFGDQKPPEIWERWLLQNARHFCVAEDTGASGGDDYHQFLMVNWFMSVAGQGGFGHQIPKGRIVFSQPRAGTGPLRELSESLYRMDGARSADWQEMRKSVGDGLSGDSQLVLNAAAEAIDKFDRFFAGFARVSMQGRTS